MSQEGCIDILISAHSHGAAALLCRYLSRNSLTSVPPEIGQLTALTYLWVPLRVFACLCMCVRTLYVCLLFWACLCMRVRACVCGRVHVRYMLMLALMCLYAYYAAAQGPV